MRSSLYKVTFFQTNIVLIENLPIGFVRDNRMRGGGRKRIFKIDK